MTEILDLVLSWSMEISWLGVAYAYENTRKEAIWRGDDVEIWSLPTASIAPINLSHQFAANTISSLIWWNLVLVESKARH